MANAHVIQRLAGIQQVLLGLHAGGASVSSATRGREREHFVDTFLSQVIGPPFRFGTGDITDSAGARSGQLDVVVEYPFLPSLPMVLPNSPRLYLAEGVAAVIEVKSDLRAQWSEVEHTAAALRPLSRKFNGNVSFFGAEPGPRIPLFAVGYLGWSTLDPIKERVDAGVVDGILIIQGGGFRSSAHFQGITATGAHALWGLICCLHQATTVLGAQGTRPLNYLL